MARIVAAYMPKALPKTFETTETHVKIVQHFVKDDDAKDGFARDENGRRMKAGPNTLEMHEVKSTGGIMFTFPRGHSFRLTDPEQIKQFRLSEQPRLVDLDSGEEVNERGVPLSLLAVINEDNKSGGNFGLEDKE